MDCNFSSESFVLSFFESSKASLIGGNFSLVVLDNHFFISSFVIISSVDSILNPSGLSKHKKTKFKKLCFNIFIVYIFYLLIF